MLQNPCKTLGFKNNMVYKTHPGRGKPYPASGLLGGLMGWGQKVNIQLCQNLVMLHIKLKRITNAATL